MRRGAALAALAVLVAANRAAADETAQGQAAFRACQSCHSLEPGKPGMAGPHLAGLKGRLLGSAEGFDYSPGFRAAKAQGLAWDAARLGAYLQDPDSVVPGGWMSPPGGLSTADRAALVAYLLGR
jgi:cytochrome c